MFWWVSGQLPPRKIGPRIITPPPGQLPPEWLPHGLLAPRQLPPRIIAPEENCTTPRIITLCMIAPGLLLPDNYLKDNCPLTISPWKLPLRKIVFWMIYCLHNCPSDKWPRGKLPRPAPRKIVPRINYTRYIFPQESENVLL